MGSGGVAKVSMWCIMEGVSCQSGGIVPAIWAIHSLVLVYFLAWSTTHPQYFTMHVIFVNGISHPLLHICMAHRKECEASPRMI